MRCTEVAGQPFPDGEFLGRDISDRGRYTPRSLKSPRSLLFWRRDQD